jgi:5-bromo-4-chloroindolyl phosphate hydrolysis protein
MDKEEILNGLGEVRHELAKVKKKLDNLNSQSIRYKEVYSELNDTVRFLHELKKGIYKTIEIEKWDLMNYIN